MKVIILYRPVSEHARRTEEFMRNIESRHLDIKLEVLNVDSREGSSMASIYDVVRYPAIIAARNDGTIQNIWEGDELPLVDEVAGYLRA